MADIPETVVMTVGELCLTIPTNGNRYFQPVVTFDRQGNVVAIRAVCSQVVHGTEQEETHGD